MRKIGKKSTLKGYYNQSSDAQEVNTNLEKRTQEKIRAMSNNESLTMDFILKNRKLLEHLKKCKVFLSKSMRKNLLKKYAVVNRPMNRRKIKHVTKNGRGRPRKIDSSQAEARLNGPSNLKSNRLSMESPQTSKSSRKGSPQISPKSSKQNSSSLQDRNVESPGPIFIRLPQKTNKRTVQKRQMFANKAENAKLIRKFGRMVFRCHVRVKRLQISDPLFTKKFKTNRKTVSFMETVEVFGESDVEYASDESVELENRVDSPQLSRTSTPLKRGRKPRNQEQMNNQMKNKKVLENKKNKKKQSKTELQRAANMKSPRKTKSPPKERSPNKKESSTIEKSKKPIKKTPKNKISPTNKATSDSQVELKEGKECFVKLNRRSSTSLLNVSSEDITEANASELPANIMNTDESKGELAGKSSVVDLESNDSVDPNNDASMTETGAESHQHESDDNSTEPLTLENEIELSKPKETNSEKNIDKADNLNRSGADEEYGENYNIDENIADVEDLNDDGNDNVEANEDANKGGINSDDGCDDQVNLTYDDPEGSERGADLGRDGNAVDYECAEDFNQAENSEGFEDGGYEVSVALNSGAAADQFNGKQNVSFNMSTSASESFHSIGESKDKNEISVESTRNSVVNCEVTTSETKVSHVYMRGKLDKIDRHESRAASVSSGLFGSKTNGAKKQNPSPIPLPDNPEDLFDLLKSNKIPEPEPALHRIPSPSQYISEDEDIDPADELRRMAPSPVPDLLDESDSANDSRFSLNTFFKSMKEKLSAKRSGTASPSKSSASADEINLRIPNET